MTRRCQAVHVVITGSGAWFDDSGETPPLPINRNEGRRGVQDARCRPRTHACRTRVQEARAARPAFQRSAGGIYQSIWFQVDKWGWDPHAGSSFFVNFAVSPTPDPERAAGREERLNYFLTDDELARAREYRDAVVARIPRPPASHCQALEQQFARVAPKTAPDLVAALRAQFEPEPLPYRRHQDFGLRYWTASDVDGWSALIRSMLPSAIEEMNSWEVPPNA